MSKPSTCTSGALLVFPKLNLRQALPAKRMFGRAMLVQMCEPVHSFFLGWLVANRNPPHSEVRLLRGLEPFGFSPVDLLVHCLPDKLLQRFGRFPDAEIDDQPRIYIDLDIGSVSGFIFQAPDGAR